MLCRPGRSGNPDHGETGKVDDDAATILAHDVAKKIEEDMEYPGQIKVVIVRETRAVDYAK